MGAEGGRLGQAKRGAAYLAAGLIPAAGLSLCSTALAPGPLSGLVSPLVGVPLAGLCLLPGALALARIATPAPAPSAELPRPLRLLALALSLCAILAFALAILGVERAGSPGPRTKVALPPDAPVTDYFHEGEILAGVPVLAAWREEGRAPPVMIHGPGRNLGPAAIAAALAPEGERIGMMRVALGAFDAMTALAAALAGAVGAAALARGGGAGSPGLAAAFGALAAAWGAVVLGETSDRLSAGFLALALGVLATGDAAQGRAGRLFFWAMLSGALAALAPLHVYRGALGAGAVLALAAILAIVLRSRAAPAVLFGALTGAAAAVAVVAACGGSELYAVALRDVRHWAGAASAWATPGDRRALVWGIWLALLFAALTAAGLRRRADRPAAAVFALLAVSVLLAPSLYAERRDAHHVAMAAAAAAPAFGALLGPFLARLAAARAPLPRLGLPAGRLLLLLPAALLIEALALRGGGILSARRALDMPDAAFIAEADRALIEDLAPDLAGQTCLPLPSNEGVLLYLAALPPCGPTLYPVYLAPGSGPRLAVAWAEAEPLGAAILTSGGWWDGIRGGLGAWAPEAEAMLRARLPREERRGERVILRAPAP